MILPNHYLRELIIFAFKIILQAWIFNFVSFVILLF